ncbi:MAG: carbamoyltransferase [Vicinamibacterales bacterium]
MPVRILGISAYYHDSAACLVEDGRIVAAAQEERFTRKKHDAAFPNQAIDYCLREAGITPAQLDHVGFYEKPLIKFSRLLETYVACAPKGWRSYLMAMPLWLSEKLWMADDISSELQGFAGEVLFGEHHESHAASAFYPSPFENAAVVTIDGVGEWATSSIGVGRGQSLEILHELKFPHSLGLLYSAFTYFAGFKVNSGEYKVMGLAPYGEPKYVNTIKDHVVEIKDDGSLWMNQEYFTYAHGLAMTGSRMADLLGGAARQPESKLTQREMDLARSIQEITEEVMLKMTAFAQRESGMTDLCLAGGVALNCVGNGRILREGAFDQIWIQPAAGDAGGALGVALSIWHKHLNKPRQSAEAQGTWQRRSSVQAPAIPKYADGMNGSYLGPDYSEADIQAAVDKGGWVATRVVPEAVAETVATHLASEKVVGLLQGRMEFGPRALGGRSILGDARSPRMQSVMNLKIKYRESFRPFAPAVLREKVAEWFDLDGDSPYMLLVADVAKDRRVPEADGADMLWGIDKLNVPRSTVPAVTHVDYSARIQTVRRETSPLYYDIIAAFNRQTGCPVIINTSFNVRGEPMVCSPDDAYRCFMRSDMDVLVIENFILEKADQPKRAEDQSWKTEFVLD